MPSMDRLSCLPDELICHILSFLPTKRSMQTSALSKRWRFLWAHVPSLKFDLDYTRRVTSGIIAKIVLPHKHDIHTFYIHGCFFSGSAKEFESCIADIATRNIRNMILDVGYPFELPQCLFTCKTMVDISLICSGDIPTSGVYFPVLKKLKYVSPYVSHETLACLLSGCPVLEELTVEGELGGHCCASSSTLTRLVLPLENGWTSKFGLMLDTPALRYLELQSTIPDRFSVRALDSLIEADMSLIWDEARQDNFTYSRHVFAFVGKLYNVKVLTLGTDRVAMIHDSPFSGSAIKFHNLTKLKLCSTLSLFTSLLENANNLVDVKLRVVYIDDKCYWREPKCVPACMSSHLRTIDVSFSRCSEEEFDVTRYILRNAKVLKRMKIDIWAKSLDTPNKLAWLESRLALVERGSQECQLELS